MGYKRHYSFATQNFKKESAHGGRSTILTKRAFQNLEATNCNFIDLTIVPPRAEIGVHTHQLNNEELYIIISGEGKMFTDGEEFDVSSGDVVFNRPGGTHGLRNTSKTEMKLVVIEIKR